MSNMIPPMLPDSTPLSERRIFKSLRDDPATKTWIVLHSLGLSGTARGIYGEIDFVVLIPDKGVICLEVKGGRVSCTDGIWTTQNQKTGESHRLKTNPYLQAREGMFALKKAVIERFGNNDVAAQCHFSFAVVFPSVLRPPQTPGEEPWETIDMEKLRSPISQSIIRTIEQTKKKSGYRHKADAVSAATLQKIKNYLRPNFERVITRSSTLRQSEARITELTEGQLDFLDMAEVNPRVLIEGAAGTGKTVLAIEFARRCAAKKESVILCCYNRMLAQWLTQQFSAEEQKTIQVSTFNSFLLAEIEQAGYKKELSDASAGKTVEHKYNELIPFYAEMALSESGTSADHLIIDEAQDLLRQNTLPVLNLMVSGGLAGGRWCLFGDFTRQAIYSDRPASESPTPHELLGARIDSQTIIPLRVNCRNTKPIGEETALLSGFESMPYRLAQATGLPVDYRYWKTKEQEQEKLKTVLEQLLEEGITPEEIVILSPVKYENSSAASIRSVGKILVTKHEDIDGQPGRCIVYSTIHAFKGLESPVVVLCGFSEFESERSRSLLYTGMSRARSHLVIVAHDKLKRSLSDMTRRRLTGDMQ